MNPKQMVFFWGLVGSAVILGLGGCAALVPAAVGGAAGWAVAKHNQPPADYIPPRPRR